MNVETIKNMLDPIFKSYNVKKAILFGSYAKGYATDRSDVDIYVESGLHGLKFFGLLEDVVTALGKDVDLIDERQIKKPSKIMDEIQKYGVVIYGK